AIVASLREPDSMAVPLHFAAATAREFGARSVGLIAPYLAYMRQDKRFHPGEAVSAPLFAQFLEQDFDWVVTVDPHLHRNPSLERIFQKPALHAVSAPLLADWIKSEINDAILIGPDGESEQWVADIAALAGVPYQILKKERHGDRDVSVSLPDPAAAQNRNPVIIDDIVSSGRTIIETLGHLKRMNLHPATCIVIHAVFSEGTYEQVLAAGAAGIVSTDTIVHASNAISVAKLLAHSTAEVMGLSWLEKSANTGK
ncbi:MAG: ribose-phosphate diphosphokinase, partial [Arenimonas sp.]